MTDQQKYTAVVQNDNHFDGVLFYGVKTTGIFCRPSCHSKVPLRENVLFFDSVAQALEAGFRPCKRCRPDLLEYTPAKNFAQQAKQLIDAHYKDENVVKVQTMTLGVSEGHLVRLFCHEFHFTPHEYLQMIRINEAKRLMQSDKRLVDIAFECGYGSLSSFYTQFKKTEGITPGQYRKSIICKGEL